jgi:hypothetical protein
LLSIAAASSAPAVTAPNASSASTPVAEPRPLDQDLQQGIGVVEYGGVYADSEGSRIAQALLAI